MHNKTVIAKRIPSYIAILLLAYMPFHIFISQWFSTFTGGLEFWKLAKDLLVVVACLLTLGLVIYYRVADKYFWWIIGFAGLYGILHVVLWLALAGDIYSRSALLGVTYNMRLPLLLGLGYGASLLWPGYMAKVIPRLVIVIGTLIAAFGVAQYFLPTDFMTHFGYSLQRGVMPAFFVDGKPDLPLRIMSTLREPNALGAYLIVPLLMTVFAMWQRSVFARRRLLMAACFGLQLLALVLTLSRSAWLGFLVAVLTLVVLVEFHLVKRYWKVLVGLFLVGIVGLALLLGPLGHTDFVERYITHSGEAEVGDPNSNGYHWIFLERGVRGIILAPLGHGPGTAGLASIQNPNGSFLTENYYVQIGYELGILGLIVLVVLHVWLYRLLRRSRVWWAPVILASFWAYIVTNMLLHSWSNEAVALWWLLAGVCARPALSLPKN